MVKGFFYMRDGNMDIHDKAREAAERELFIDSYNTLAKPDHWPDGYFATEDFMTEEGAETSFKFGFIQQAWIGFKLARALTASEAKAAPAEPVAAQPQEAGRELSDESLLQAFNSGDSVLDGLHEVASLVIRNLWPKGDYEATVTLLRGLVDCQHSKLVAQAASAALLSEAIDRINDMLLGDDGQAFKEAHRFVDKVAAPSAPSQEGKA